uniref:Uncharacterized protein n=1 Tax=Dendroctonus ponderosae TaxID=77166 RepID=A0AAR5Q6L1_DENPD
MSITRKVSIHFKGKKEKERLKKLAMGGVGDPKSPDPQKTPSIDSKKSTTEASNCDPKTPNSSESDKKKEKKGRKSVSVSPDRNRHVHMQHDGLAAKKHKKHRRERSGGRTRRGSTDPRMRERSFSVCTDRSLGAGGAAGSFLYEEYSDRERTNSGSSCESPDNHRKFSGISNAPLNGKLPWCGCWGNGCL